MNKTVNIVFVVLGVLFVIVVLMGIGFYLSMSFNSASSNYATSPTAHVSSDTASTSTQEVSDTAFTLTSGQKAALSSFGIDPATVPSSITTEQESCFVAALGTQRVEEIKSGDTPSAIDFLRAKSCI